MLGKGCMTSHPTGLCQSVSTVHFAHTPEHFRSLKQDAGGAMQLSMWHQDHLSLLSCHFHVGS